VRPKRSNPSVKMPGGCSSSDASSRFCCSSSSRFRLCSRQFTGFRRRNPSRGRRCGIHTRASPETGKKPTCTRTAWRGAA
jgi:hypothetical protein